MKESKPRTNGHRFCVTPSACRNFRIQWNYAGYDLMGENILGSNDSPPTETHLVPGISWVLQKWVGACTQSTDSLTGGLSGHMCPWSAHCWWPSGPSERGHAATNCQYLRPPRTAAVRPYTTRYPGSDVENSYLSNPPPKHTYLDISTHIIPEGPFILCIDASNKYMNKKEIC